MECVKCGTQKAWRALKSMMSNRGLGINEKYLYEEVIVPMALHGAEACGMGSAE